MQLADGRLERAGRGQQSHDGKNGDFVGFNSFSILLIVVMESGSSDAISRWRVRKGRVE